MQLTLDGRSLAIDTEEALLEAQAVCSRSDKDLRSGGVQRVLGVVLLVVSGRRDVSGLCGHLVCVRKGNSAATADDHTSMM